MNRFFKKKFHCFFVWFCCSICAKAQTAQLNIKPNTFADVTQQVQQAIDSCRGKSQSTLVFAKGRYDFWPDKATPTAYYISNSSSETEFPVKRQKVGLHFKNQKNITIDGNGAQFVFHGKMITWAIDSSENIQIKNITVTYERPGMSEMTIKSVAKNAVTVVMHPDSKFDIIDGKIALYGEKWKMENAYAALVNPASGMVTHSNWAPFLNAKAETIAPLTIKFTGNFDNFTGQTNHVLTVRDRYRDYVGVLHNRSKNITLKNLNMRYMHGLGIISQFCENLDYDSVYIEPGATSGRVIASSADGMHFSGCKGYININHCRFSGLHDDPINVHGTYLKVSEIVSPTKIKLRFMHQQSYGFAAFAKGDTLAYLNPTTLGALGRGVVKYASLTNPYETEIELEHPIPRQLSTSHVLENLSWTPTVAIRNSRFERTISRGTITKTPRKVLIENNLYYRTGMQAILIIIDASYWYESGAVKDVTIRNNQFIECGHNAGTENYPIKITAQNPKIMPGHYVHKNITISNNMFKIYDYPVLSARSTQGLRFVNNRIEKSYLMPAGKKRANFNLFACSKVTIKGNTFPKEEKAEISLQNMSKKEIKTDLKQP